MPASGQELKEKLKTLLENLNLNDGGVDVNQEWSSIHVAVKETSLQRSSENNDTDLELDTQIDNLLNDIVPQFFRYWSKQNKITVDSYKGFMDAIKLYHELRSTVETGVFTTDKVKQFKSRLQAVESKMKAFSSLEEGECYDQAFKIFQSKVGTCKSYLELLETELNSISPALMPIRNRLVEIKMDLDVLLARKDPFGFTLAQVQMLQDDIREIDNARIDGKFVSRDEEIVPGQASVVNLIETCYDGIHELLGMRDPVLTSNPLRPIYEDLIEIKAELEHIALYCNWSIKGDDLVPLQRRLGEIDNLRKDGIFLAKDGSIPEGQGILHFLMHKCYRIIYKLQSNMDPVHESLMPLYRQLLTLKSCLQQLLQWKVELTFNELIPYQLKWSTVASLVIHPNKQKDGKFHDQNGEIPEGQAILIELLEECHEYLEQMKESCVE